MTKNMYISSIRIKIKNLPQDDIDDAMRYIEEYFEEAGEGNEQEVMKELGTPEKVANQIKADYTIKNMTNTSTKKQKNSSLKDLLLIIFGILSLPVAVPIAIVIFVLFFVLLLVIGIFGFVFAILVFCGLLTGIALIGVGLWNITVALGSAIYTIGIGFMVLGVGFVGYGLVSILFKNGIPKISSWAANFYHKVKGDVSHE